MLCTLVNPLTNWLRICSYWFLCTVHAAYSDWSRVLQPIIERCMLLQITPWDSTSWQRWPWLYIIAAFGYVVHVIKCTEACVQIRGSVLGSSPSLAVASPLALSWLALGPSLGSGPSPRPGFSFSLGSLGRKGSQTKRPHEGCVSVSAANPKTMTFYLAKPPLWMWLCHVCLLLPPQGHPEAPTLRTSWGALPPPTLRTPWGALPPHAVVFLYVWIPVYFLAAFFMWSCESKRNNWMYFKKALGLHKNALLLLIK